MNFRTALLSEHSKKQTLKITQFIGNDPQLFAELMELFFANEYLVTQRASWVVSNCFDNYAMLILPYLKPLLKNLEKENIHDAVKRNTLRMLQFIELPKKLQGLAFQNCMTLLHSPNEAIAVKVFAMTVMANICKQEPDLKRELQFEIEAQLPYGSSGFKNRGNKLLKILKTLG